MIEPRYPRDARAFDAGAAWTTGTSWAAPPVVGGVNRTIGKIVDADAFTEQIVEMNVCIAGRGHHDIVIFVGDYVARDERASDRGTPLRRC
jgi:hypothetical protein